MSMVTLTSYPLLTSMKVEKVSLHPFLVVYGVILCDSTRRRKVTP